MRSPHTLSPPLSKAHTPLFSSEEIEIVCTKGRIYNGLDAVRHMFHVASSLDSLIVGEREIITQVRKAHDHYNKLKMSGDFIRIAITKAIETAKAVYTQTEIATKPISVVNLGFKKLLERDLGDHHSVLFVGAGTTIEAIAGNLKSIKPKEIKIFNRTESKSHFPCENTRWERAFHSINSNPKPGHLTSLSPATGSDSSIITIDLFKEMTKGDGRKVTILDLAVPADTDSSLAKQPYVDYISIDDLKEEAKANLKEREKEIFHCENLVEERLEDFEDSFRARRLELAMSQIPRLMKEIKTNALENKFARNLENMTPKDKETLHEIVNYLEKKVHLTSDENGKASCSQQRP